MVRTTHISALALSLVSSAISSPTPGGTPPYGPPPYGGGNPYGSQILPITGPVITSNFPDPCFIQDNGVYYAFGTETNEQLPRIHVATSNDFVHWQLQQGADGLAYEPPWANTTLYRNTWAPDVTRADDGSFVMLFSALLKNTDGVHCIGVGRSNVPKGPYVPDTKPLVCPGSYGIIDASLFRDWDGQRYIVYKEDRTGTALDVQKISADARTLTSGITTLLRNRGASDGNNIEAPQIIRASDDGTYVLFFSSGNFEDASYTVSYATSRSVLGPYVRKGAAVTSQSSGIRGPGGMQLNPQGDKMVFHGLIDHATPIPNRGMWVAGTRIQRGVVTVG